MKETGRQKIRKEVFIPSFALVLIAAVIGVTSNEALVSIAKTLFYISLTEFGWLYQISSVLALVVVTYIFFSKVGSIRIGGDKAKPEFSFMTTFAIALTAGIATGVVTYSVNEPLIYLGNIYGEIDHQNFAAGSKEAAVFALARSFHNWSFIPYAIYSLVGLMIAYMHYNKKKAFSISSAIEPILGDKANNSLVRTVVDIVSLLAIALGLASGLGTGLILISSGLESIYGIEPNHFVFLVISAVITVVFIASSLSGLKRGIRALSSLNAYIFYGLIITLIVFGPFSYILSLSTTAVGYWLDNFFLWSFDTRESGGEALVTWWTLFDWSIWVAYAPLIGLFLARISYGRTIREFLVINWIMPAVFGLIWFAVWGGSAIKWQLDGTLDLVSIIVEKGAVYGLWGFMEYFPLSWVLIPILLFTFVLSFSTAADSLSATIAAICTKDINATEESPKSLKIIWGISIGIIAFVMAAFGGGEQGIDGIKYLAAAGGFTVVFLFLLVVISAIKTFIYVPGQKNNQLNNKNVYQEKGVENGFKFGAE